MNPPRLSSAGWGKGLKCRPFPTPPSRSNPFAILSIELVQNTGLVSTHTILRFSPVVRKITFTTIEMI
jgi:hypothetical protein